MNEVNELVRIKLHAIEVADMRPARNGAGHT